MVAQTSVRVRASGVDTFKTDLTNATGSQHVVKDKEYFIDPRREIAFLLVQSIQLQI